MFQTSTGQTTSTRKFRLLFGVVCSTFFGTGIATNPKKLTAYETTASAKQAGVLVLHEKWYNHNIIMNDGDWPDREASDGASGTHRSHPMNDITRRMQRLPLAGPRQVGEPEPESESRHGPDNEANDGSSGEAENVRGSCFKKLNFFFKEHLEFPFVFSLLWVIVSGVLVGTSIASRGTICALASGVAMIIFSTGFLYYMATLMIDKKYPSRDSELPPKTITCLRIFGSSYFGCSMGFISLGAYFTKLKVDTECDVANAVVFFALGVVFLVVALMVICVLRDGV